MSAMRTPRIKLTDLMHPLKISNFKLRIIFKI